MFSTVR